MIIHSLIMNFLNFLLNYNNFQLNMRLFGPLFLANLIKIVLTLNGFHFELDLKQTSKQTTPLWNTTCNHGPYIHFLFSANTVLSECLTQRCRITNSGESKLIYQDIIFERSQYSLQGLYLNNKPYRKNTSLELILVYDSLNNTNVEIWVVVPLIYTNQVESEAGKYVIEFQAIKPYLNNSQSLSQIRHFQRFVDFLLEKKTHNLTQAFSFLNSRDYAHFYHLSGSKDNNSKTIVFLLSTYIYQVIETDIINTNISLNLPSATVNYSLTGDKYCFCSRQPFSSNIHESIALWTSWFHILISCVLIMWPRDKTQNLWNNRFAQNKWTTLPIYSLFHLQHNQFFSRTLRMSMPMTKISIHMLVLSIFYALLVQHLHAILIAFSFIPAVFLGQLFGHILGYIFLRRINQEHLRKIKMQLEDLQSQRKEEKQMNEYTILDSQEYLQTLYFWYYVIMLLMFIVASTLAIYVMELLPFQLHMIGAVYWLISLGICFIVDNFIVDLLLTVCFGKTTFMKSKGYFYDIQLGRTYKKTLQLF